MPSSSTPFTETNAEQIGEVDSSDLPAARKGKKTDFLVMEGV